jgi:F-type H+-transporting ATPase subunit delta
LDSNSLRRALCAGAQPVNEVTRTSVKVAGEDPIISGMAGRYAGALFELAREDKAIDQVKKDLETFDDLIVGSPDLTRLVRSPVFGVEDQMKAISAILAKAKIKGLAANFLRVITANRRLFALREIIRGYRALVARHKGEVSAQITVAEKLSDKHLTALKSALRSVTGGKDFDLDVKIDPAIIGGLIVKVGSRMVDSSLRTKLNAIKFAMKEAR